MAFEVIQKGDTICKQPIKKKKKLESIIEHLYSATPFESWYYTNSTDNIEYGYQTTQQGIEIHYSPSQSLITKDKWKDIHKIFSQCGMNFEDYFCKVDQERMDTIINAVKTSRSYEQKNNKSFLDISEVAEVCAAYLLDLWLSKSKITPGFDAFDEYMNRVQIKSRKKYEGSRTGKSGIFSKYEYDYAIMVVFTMDFKIENIYKVEKTAIDNALDKKRQITISKMIEASEKNFICNPGNVTINELGVQ